MRRSLLICGLLCTFPACLPPPGAPRILQTPVTGNWTGTFESSWGTLPVTATLANEKYSQGISGTYAVDGQRATGTLGGSLQTVDEDSPGLLHGTISIAYPLAGGGICHSTSQVGGGYATEKVFEVKIDGFPRGNCPDSPRNVTLTLRR